MLDRWQKRTSWRRRVDLRHDAVLLLGRRQMTLQLAARGYLEVEQTR